MTDIGGAPLDGAETAVPADTLGTVEVLQQQLGRAHAEAEGLQLLLNEANELGRAAETECERLQTALQTATADNGLLRAELADATLRADTVTEQLHRLAPMPEATAPSSSAGDTAPAEREPISGEPVIYQGGTAFVVRVLELGALELLVHGETYVHAAAGEWTWPAP